VTTSQLPALLPGRVAVVTGGAQGIGLAIATRFAEHGASVAIADLDEARCSEVAAEIARRTGVATVGVGVDVTDPEAVRRAADQVATSLGVCDLIVPNAGILVLKPALELTTQEFSSVVEVNLTGAYLTAAEFGRRLVSSGQSGQILFTSSLFGLRGGVGNAAYSASKFGLIGLAQSMAAELAGNGIRVNCVCPGQISSAMLDQLFVDRAAANATSADHERELFVNRIPQHRLGDAADVADTYVYLASSLSSYVTGQHVVVDGGWTVG
jgi:NAD(P)-dependent dehydrogenase (short-subunit alcohol dehydrogenase family)